MALRRESWPRDLTGAEGWGWCGSYAAGRMPPTASGIAFRFAFCAGRAWPAHGLFEKHLSEELLPPLRGSKI